MNTAFYYVKLFSKAVLATAVLMAAVLLFAVTTAALAGAQTIACDADSRATHTSIQFCTSINTSTTPATCNTWGAWGPDTPVVPGPTASIDLCNHSVATVAVGNHIVRVKAIDIASAWTGGREESAPSAPFAFARPAALATPGGIRLVP
jgi:hypothetical protein